MLMEQKTLGTRVIALKRRLTTGTLTPEDKERFELTRRLRELRRDGKTIEECAGLLGMRREMIGQFMRRGVFEAFSQHLESLERGTDEKAVEHVVRMARKDFAGFAPDAITYYRSCFMRNAEEERAEKGEFKDDAKAMWATDKVSKGLGLTEPETAVRPIVHINVGYIRNEMLRVAEDDAEAEAAARAITVTPQDASPKNAISDDGPPVAS